MLHQHSAQHGSGQGKVVQDARLGTIAVLSSLFVLAGVETGEWRYLMLLLDVSRLPLNCS